jgi:hypothetical protein
MLAVLKSLHTHRRAWPLRLTVACAATLIAVTITASSALAFPMCGY